MGPLIKTVTEGGGAVPNLYPKPLKPEAESSGVLPAVTRVEAGPGYREPLRSLHDTWGQLEGLGALGRLHGLYRFQGV